MHHFITPPVERAWGQVCRTWTDAAAPVLLLALVIWVVPQALSAATIEPYVDAEMGCDLRLSGTIVAGDAERLAEVAEDVREEVARRRFDAAGISAGTASMAVYRDAYSGPKLCLDSPGGTLQAAYRLIQVVSEKAMPTAVGRGAHCESACALVFFAGRYSEMGHGVSAESTDRTLHPEGRLGFHAPKLDLAGDNFTSEQVEQAYALGMSTISEIVESGIIPVPMLVRMLETPPSEMAYVETIGQAVLFDIKVGPVPLASVPPITLIENACSNAATFRLGTINALELPVEDDWMTDEFGRVVIMLNAGGAWSCGLRAIGEDLYYSDVGVFDADTVIGATRRGMPRFSPYMTYDAKTRLTDLPEYDAQNNAQTLKAVITALGTR